jgi:hypothetical protein
LQTAYEESVTRCFAGKAPRHLSNHLARPVLRDVENGMEAQREMLLTEKRRTIERRIS